LSKFYWSKVVASVACFVVSFFGLATAQAIHYEIDEATFGPIVTELVDGRRVDLVFPHAAIARPLATIVFVLGFPDDATSFGPLIDYQTYRDWARIVASRGFVGVLYSTTDPVPDLQAVMDFLASEGPRLGLDPGRMAIWSVSANVPTALHYVRSGAVPAARALVTYYGLMPTPDGFQAQALETGSSRQGFALPDYHPTQLFPRDLPLLVVRAGRDASPPLLASIDRFVEYAVSENLSIRLINYPEGQHGFDTHDDTPETRSIITETLDFLARHLGR
jgi:hypothetical protein